MNDDQKWLDGIKNIGKAIGNFAKKVRKEIC